MIEEPRARELGSAAFEPGDDVAVLGSARELGQGWFFPVIAKHDLYVGVMVNKETGRVLKIMIHSSLARDPTLYDRGYQFDSYDLVVLKIADMDQTVGTILELHEVTLDTYYRYGRVYRVGRALTETEVRERLSALPAVFCGRAVSQLERFEEAREAGWFEFKLFEYRGKESS